MKKELEQKIKELTEENNRLKKINNDLKSKIGVHNTEIMALKNKISRYKTAINKLNNL